jgi:hypothetical protein
MGADGYADNAITCVEKAKELITMIRLASAE